MCEGIARCEIRLCILERGLGGRYQRLEEVAVKDPDFVERFVHGGHRGVEAPML